MIACYCQFFPRIEGIVVLEVAELGVRMVWKYVWGLGGNICWRPSRGQIQSLKNKFTFQANAAQEKSGNTMALKYHVLVLLAGYLDVLNSLLRLHVGIEVLEVSVDESLEQYQWFDFDSINASNYRSRQS